MRSQLVILGALAALACGTRDGGQGRAVTDTTGVPRDLALAPRRVPALPTLHDVPLEPAHRLRDPARGVPAGPPAAAVTSVAPATPVATSPSPAPAPATTHRIMVADSLVSSPPPTGLAPAAPAPGGAAPGAGVGAGARAGGGVASGILPAGTVVVLHPHVAVCARMNEVGDLFVATLGSPIIASSGLTVPAGVIVTVQVSAFDRTADSGATMEFVVRGFGREPDGAVPVLHAIADSGATAAWSGGRAPIAPSDPLVGHARTERTPLGSCVPSEGTLRIVLVHAAQLVIPPPVVSPPA